LQVQLAFIAGLMVVVALIPINRWLAQQIQLASIEMMSAKDVRLGILQVCLLLDTQSLQLAWSQLACAPFHSRE
jgi:hypothetical protein